MGYVIIPFQMQQSPPILVPDISRYNSQRNGVSLTEPGPPVPPPPPPPPVERVFMVDPARCTWLNGRAEPETIIDNRYLVLRSGQKGTLIEEDPSGWKKLRFDKVEAWMSGYYLKEIS